MPRLILLNGPPGSGKSTLAQRYADDHPMTLDLDIDVVRSMIGGWLDEPEQAGLQARRLAIAMARAHLESDRDVIVPQYLGRLAFVEQLDGLADDAGSQFCELALMVDRAGATERFKRRARSPSTAAHRDAHTLVERAGGSAALDRMYDRLLDVLAERPRTSVVPAADEDIEATYQRLVRALDP